MLPNWLTGPMPGSETGVLGQGGSFSNEIRTADNETDAEIRTAQALFNVQMMENWEPGMQINFSTQFRQRHQIYRRVEVKVRDLERVGGIFMSYRRTGVWFRLRTDATLLFSPCLGFFGCCHGNCQLCWSGWVCHLAF